MNAKYALALILILQVSMSLCEEPTPSQEVVDKCNTMRATFYKRLLTAFNKLQASAAAFAQGSPVVQSVKDLISDPVATTYIGAASSVGSGLIIEANPLMDRAVTAMQDLCVLILSSQGGPYVNDGIVDAQFFLDHFLPAQ